MLSRRKLQKPTKNLNMIAQKTVKTDFKHKIKLSSSKVCYLNNWTLSFDQEMMRRQIWRCLCEEYYGRKLCLPQVGSSSLVRFPQASAGFCYPTKAVKKWTTRADKFSRLFSILTIASFRSNCNVHIIQSIKEIDKTMTPLALSML